MTERDINVALALQLRLLRIEAGLSQDELAARLGVHRNTVYHWERGCGLPTVLFLKACMVLNADAARILKAVIHG